MNNNTYTLIMVDELGDEVVVDRWSLSLLTDPDEIRAWKQIKLEKARMMFPEACGFYWEDSASLYWSVAEASNSEGSWYDEDDEDDMLAHNLYRG